MSYINVNNSNFDKEVLDSDIPVLVDFWAQWCHFCVMIAPVIEELADELDGKIKVCKLDCDEAQDLAVSYGISSIPSFMLFDGGEEKGTLVGAMSKEEILDFIKKSL